MAEVSILGGLLCTPLLWDPPQGAKLIFLYPMGTRNDWVHVPKWLFWGGILGMPGYAHHTGGVNSPDQVGIARLVPLAEEGGLQGLAEGGGIGGRIWRPGGVRV